MKKKIITGEIFVDDRGYVISYNSFNFLNIKRFYRVQNHRSNFIRAWHGHKKESKYVYVSKGAALIGIVNLKNNKVFTKTLSEKKIELLYVPAGSANGFKTLEKNTELVFFSDKKLYRC